MITINVRLGIKINPIVKVEIWFKLPSAYYNEVNQVKMPILFGPANGLR